VLLLTAEQMQQADEKAVELGIPEILLMETAGRAVARWLEELARPETSEEIVILTGSGNNGGDGLVAARYLDRRGYQVKVILLKSPEEFTGITAQNYRFCQLAGIRMQEIAELEREELREQLNRVAYLVDALLGTGITGAARGLAAEVIELTNNQAKPVLAVDVPSGLNVNSGKAEGPVIEADWTVTMASLKLGQILYPGRSFCGQIQVVDLDFPPEVYQGLEVENYMLNEEEASLLLPHRPETGHKGSFGRILVVAGSQGMSGAALLSGLSALRSGAGLVELAAPRVVVEAAAAGAPELITRELPSEQGRLTGESCSEILEAAAKADVLLLGPGMGRSPELEELIFQLLSSLEIPAVIDADGLNNISSLTLLKDFSRELAVTPHPGEMARLTGLSLEEVLAGRLSLASDFARENSLSLVLKGADSLIALPEGELFVNPTGCEAMATAGSGDVLAGVIAALIAQGLPAEKAACLGTYLHGRAGELAGEDLSSYSVIAGDILDYLPEAFISMEQVYQ